MLSCVQHERLINSGPDQTASRFADSDLVLHYLPMSHKKDAILIKVKQRYAAEFFLCLYAIH